MPVAWDEFRLVRAIAECGALAPAAGQLGINPSTAFRRLAALEAGLGARLFERHRSGYVPTPAGEAMVAAAARMEEEAARFDREVADRASVPSGILRVTAPAGLAIDLMMPMLARFRARYPRVRLDLVVSEEALNLSRRDADVALRATREPPANLVGRRLSGVAWAVYGPVEGDLAADRPGSVRTRAWPGGVRPLRRRTRPARAGRAADQHRPGPVRGGGGGHRHRRAALLRRRSASGSAPPVRPGAGPGGRTLAPDPSRPAPLGAGPRLPGARRRRDRAAAARPGGADGGRVF